MFNMTVVRSKSQNNSLVQITHFLRSVVLDNELDHSGQIGHLKGWQTLAAFRLS
jgi:hypothetical protein